MWYNNSHNMGIESKDIKLNRNYEVYFLLMPDISVFNEKTIR